MICPSSISLGQLAVEQLLATRAPSEGSRVLGIAGYPYTGKTHLARAIQKAWPDGPTAVLPTESAVLPRAARQLLGVDGCSPEGHEMQELLELVESLRNGRAVECNDYSWLAAGPVGTFILDGLTERGLLILDGTVAAATPILEQCNLLIFLSPADPEVWLRLACVRDVATRGWAPTPAQTANMLKSQTSARLRHTAEGSLTINVLVDPITWTWFLPDCDLCQQKTCDLVAHAPVALPTCKAG